MPLSNPTEIIVLDEGVEVSRRPVHNFTGAGVVATDNAVNNRVDVTIGGGGVTDHGALTGLSDDDHPQYILHSLATAENDMVVASGVGAFIKKTLAEVKTLLGIASDIATHAGLTTGVHGVGAGTVAKTADITATKIDDLTAGDDNTDLDTSTTKHGLAPKAVAPTSGLINVLGIANSETAITNKSLFDATVPSTQAIADAAATGTATVSARRDHKHAMPSQATMDAASVAAVNAAGISPAENFGFTLDAVLSGNGKWTGIVVAGVLGATVAFGEVVYFKSSDSQWYLAKADATATSGAVKVGICLVAGNDNDATTILLFGKVFATAYSLTVGAPVFISAATAGVLTSTAPTGTTNFVVRIVGYCVATDELFFQPDNTYLELA